MRGCKYRTVRDMLWLLADGLVTALNVTINGERVTASLFHDQKRWGGMEAIISFISAHWTEWLFTAVLALLSWAFRGLRAQLQEEHDRNEAIAAGVQSLLRESIVNGYNRYSDKGFCPIYAKESIKRVYQSYHDLGGNDVATELYSKIFKMPENREEGSGK